MRTLEDSGASPREDGNQLRESRAMLRKDVEEAKAEMSRLNEEAKQEESKSGKRVVVEREGERVEIKRRCWDRVRSHGECWGREGEGPLVFRCVCVLAVSSSVLVGPVVRWVRLSFLILIVNLLSRRHFLSPESAKRFLQKVKKT